ncbi:MAG TPA: hypothetical protein VFF68_02270 [Anaerolineaceae bacterium]|nr:hypothetical protein [Anaerolineaceae bacterium]
MRGKRTFALGWIACLGLLGTLAGCGRGLPAAPASSGLNELLRATWTPVYSEGAPIAIAAAGSDELAATERPVPTVAPFELGAEVYRHPGGYFQAPLPAGWTVAEELDDQVLLADSRWRRSIRVGVTYTGVPLDGTAFERFVRSREQNRFARRGSYETLTERIDSAGGTARLEKMQTDGWQSVWAASDYRRSGAAILWVDFQQAAYLAPYLAPPPAELLRQVSIDANLAAALPPYASTFDLGDPGGVFELQVPEAWSYRQSVRDSVVAHWIESPDHNVQVQLIVSAEENGFSDQVAGNLALELLRSLNPVPIEVTADVVRSDGVEYLVWNQVDGGSRGNSFFAVRGTTFLMLTVLVDDQERVHDQTAIQAVQNSFHLP